MSADGSVTLVWGDGENKFKFAIGQFRELQEKVTKRRIDLGIPAIGPLTLLNSLRSQDAWPDDVRDVLRIGLVGAGMPIKDAHKKLTLYFDDKPPFEHMLVAYACLFAGLVGVPADAEKELKKKTMSSTKTDQSTSESSTEPAPH